MGQTEYTSFAKRFALASTTICGNPECRRGTKEIDGEVSLESKTVLAPRRAYMTQHKHLATLSCQPRHRRRFQ